MALPLYKRIIEKTKFQHNCYSEACLQRGVNLIIGSAEIPENLYFYIQYIFNDAGYAIDAKIQLVRLDSDGEWITCNEVTCSQMNRERFQAAIDTCSIIEESIPPESRELLYYNENYSDLDYVETN